MAALVAFLHRNGQKPDFVGTDGEVGRFDLTLFIAIVW
jgi:hypothetical protein